MCYYEVYISITTHYMGAKMKQAKVLSKDETKRLLSIAKDGKYGVRDVCLIHMSFYLGLRVKELASLKLGDVVNDDGSIVDSFYLTDSQSKGNGGGTIYLTHKGVRKSLTEYLDWRNSKCITSSHLFWSQKGGCFIPNTLQMLFSRLYKKAGFKGCSSHSGRRTFATSLIRKGYDIKSVSVLLRHSSITTTSRYIDTNPVMLGDMVSKL